MDTVTAGHFENLFSIANPGEFLLCGEILEEMKQAALGMGFPLFRSFMEPFNCHTYLPSKLQKLGIL